MNKLRNHFFVYERKIFSTKGRFYLRKEGFIIVYIVVLTYICYKINKFCLQKEDFCLQKEALSTKGRYLLGLGSEIWSMKRR